MSICLVAFAVLAVMGIFSAKYRRWAREAFNCVKRNITLRPCDTDFRQRIKSALTSRFMGRSQRAGRFVYRNFEALSWLFTALFFATLIVSGWSLLNLAVYGTCSPDNPGNCLFGTEPTCNSGDICDPCLCEQETCSAPEYAACGGDCNCRMEVCEGMQNISQN